MIMPKVFDILSDPNVDRSVKVRTIPIIGDFIQEGVNKFEPYMIKAM